MLTHYLNYRKRIHHRVDAFKAHQSFLLSGKYMMRVGHENLIFRNDPETKMNLHNLLNISFHPPANLLNYKEYIKETLLPKRLEVLNNAKSNCFQGTAMYSPSSRMGIKIFNFNRLEVLTTYVDDETFRQHLENYSYFSTYFNVPKIITYTANEKTCVEELIPHKSRYAWTLNDEQKVMDQLFDLYKRYYQACILERKVRNTTIHHKLNAIKKDPILSKMGYLLERVLPVNLIVMELPCVSQHGDIWSSNVLISKEGKENLFFIDWEHSGEYVFFFDFFKWIDVETFENKNDHYLEKFISGRYDHKFDELFSLFGMHYDEKHKVAYYYIHLIEYIYKRVLDKQIHRKKYIYQKYYTFVEKLQQSVPT